MFVLIDNYDSFTWNLWHFLSDLGAEVEILRNDAMSADDVIARDEVDAARRLGHLPTEYMSQRAINEELSKRLDRLLPHEPIQVFEPRHDGVQRRVQRLPSQDGPQVGKRLKRQLTYLPLALPV